MRPMMPMASDEGSGPGRSTCGTPSSSPATISAASESLLWLMGMNTGVRPCFSYTYLAQSAMAWALALKPGQSRRAKPA